MKAKFTKGDWEFTTCGSSVSVWCGNTSIIGHKNFNYPNDKYSDEILANAHLIASAPEMYKMIKGLSKELELAITKINTVTIKNITPQTETQHDLWDMESLHDAEVLLAKARGEE